MPEASASALPPETDRLARRVLDEACDRGVRLVTAEACTGGLLAAVLTDVPSASQAFDRGFVASTDEARHDLLGVSRQILDQDGAVSERCARAMAEGALARSPGEIAVAITGFTVAGVAADEPGGLVHLATACRGQPTYHRVMRFGDLGRDAVRLKALHVALEMLSHRMIRAANAA